MAGSQDPQDNPVGVNVVPLVDIIFCLCVFFMCSFKFRALEAKFDAWMPLDKGPPDGPPLPVVLPSEMRIAMTWDERTQTLTRRFGLRSFPEDAALAAVIAEAKLAWADKGHPDAPLTVDADVHVPWKEVVGVVDLAKGCGIGRIEFAMGAAPKPRAGAR